MNILIISTPNPYKTAGIVAYNLYKGLKNEGNNTKLLIKLYGKYHEDDIICMESSFDFFVIKARNKFKGWMMRLTFLRSKRIKTNPEYHVQDIDQTQQIYKTSTILKKVGFKPDAIIYLFQQNFLSAKNLFELNKITNAKIYWYLMDTAALTGACHYSWDCKRYMNGCGKCPALYSNRENDQSAINFSFKKKYLSKTDINIISPTEWQNKKAVESELFKDKPINKILLSIDPQVYSYLPKLEGKQKLKINSTRKVIFFGSTSINHKRKGMKYLIEALSILKNSPAQSKVDILLLVAGNYDDMFTTLPFEYNYLGLLANNEQLALAYNAADVFVCPSIEDSGPMMINQSIMCGTPVVSFNMGVAEDLVITGETGYRAKLYDSSDMYKGIDYVLSLSDQEHQNMCSNCRTLALNNFTLDVSTKKITKLLQTDLLI